MKQIICHTLLLLIGSLLIGQSESLNLFDANRDYPFGRLNPGAPKEVGDWAPLIGECDCRSEQRNPDGTWADPTEMLWRFKYILNGTAVQDETFKSDGVHSGSLRLYNPDSLRWFVHWYSTQPVAPQLSTWEGGVTGDQIVLYREQQAPNGMEGFYRLTFSDISEAGFNWVGEWVDPDEKIVYPTWRIYCKKRKT